MRIEQADIYVVKVDKHYRVGGHESAPNRLPGTDYYFEPQWRQAYSRLTESCLIKLTTSNGLTGWGEAQAPLSPETPASILVRLFAPALIGQPALASEWVYERLYHMMLVRGHNARLSAGCHWSYRHRALGHSGPSVECSRFRATWRPIANAASSLFVRLAETDFRRANQSGQSKQLRAECAA